MGTAGGRRLAGGRPGGGPRTQSDGERDVIDGVVDTLFGELCHQLPARTLVVAGVALPACARCAGGYLGVLLTLGFFALPGRPRVFLAYPSRGGAALAALAFLPAFVDFVLARTGSSRALDNEWRFLLSLLAGWGVGILLVGAAASVRWGLEPARRVSAGHLAGSLAILLLPGLAFVVPAPWGARALTYGVAAGAVALYALLNYIPVAVFLPRRPLGPLARGGVLLGVVALAAAEIRWGYEVYAAVRGMLF
ncbi:MAG: DUF2085 domain-containing protein [Candidatus Coatesbacteria bacterium]|nr:MAG: DUF2085 domain-containing protein [Candidatus Coatesbacteria bacterium]